MAVLLYGNALWWNEMENEKQKLEQPEHEQYWRLHVLCARSDIALDATTGTQLQRRTG